MTSRYSTTVGGFTTTTANLDIYVSDINGNDGNDGLTPATALKTVQMAGNRIPAGIGFRVIVHMGRHGGTGYATPQINHEAIMGANLWFIGDGAGQAGETGFTQIKAPAASQGGTTVAQVVTGGGLVVDTYRGQTVEITSGAATGDRRTIRNNDATNIYPTRPFSAGFAAGDTYRVVEPDVVWMFSPTSGASAILVSGANQASADPWVWDYSTYFVNMKWSGSSAATFYTIHGSRVVLVGIQCDTVITNVQVPIHEWNSSVVGLGQDVHDIVGSAPLMLGAVADMGVPSSTSWLGWTMSQRTAAVTGNGLNLNGVHVHGSVVTNAVALGFFAKLNLNGGNLFGGGSTAASLSVTNGAVCAMAGPSAALNILISSSALTVGALQTSAGGIVVGGSNTLITNSAGFGVRATTGGLFTGLASSVTGTGALFGCVAQAGGRIFWNSTAPTVLGPAGADLTVDTTAGGGLGVSLAAATLAAAGDFIGSPDGSLIERV